MFDFLRRWLPSRTNWWTEEEEPQKFTSAQLIIMRPTELRNFTFTKSFLVERVAWPGRSKEFVRDFRKTCRLLKKNPHPGVLTLADYYDRPDRLFRVWRRREVNPACISPVNDHKSLVPFIEGLQHLKRLGFSYDHFSSDCYSVDESGPFTIKLPYNLRGSHVEDPNEPVFRSPHSPYYLNPNSEASDDAFWLYAMGGIFCTMLKQGFPFEDIPMFLAQAGQPIVKQPMAIEGPVGETLNRFLAVNDEKPFSTIEEGLNTLKEALLATEEIRYRPEVANTWKEVNHSIILPHEMQTEWLEFSKGFSSN